MDAGVERVPDEEQQARSRAVARGVMVRSLLVAGIGTALAWALPVS